MTDLNKEREAFEATESISKVIHKFEWCEELNSYKVKERLERDSVFEAIEAEKQLTFLNGTWYGWILAKAYTAKAQAMPETHKHSVTLSCAELKEAFDFGAPDGEKDQFQMETKMLIKWLDDGYDGAGYYCWYADLQEEGCIKLGESESGAEG